MANKLKLKYVFDDKCQKDENKGHNGDQTKQVKL